MLSESESTTFPDPLEPPAKKKAVEPELAVPLEEVEKKGREPRACTIRDDEPSVLKMCLDYLHKQLLR